MGKVKGADGGAGLTVHLDSVDAKEIVGWCDFAEVSPQEVRFSILLGQNRIPVISRLFERADLRSAEGGNGRRLGVEIDLNNITNRRAILGCVNGGTVESPLSVTLIAEWQASQATSRSIELSRDEFLQTAGFLPDRSGQWTDPNDFEVFLPSGDRPHERTEHEIEDLKTIAFYLPQFYPLAVNDRVWGQGFTEWTNVVEAKPNYPGHGMPLKPADLGFYDARLSATRKRQADLAKLFNIDAFCYYYYWFSGQRVMTEVIDDLLRVGGDDFPYCLCWANETWSRRWDGSEQEVILKQEHDPDEDIKLIDELIPHFRSPNYLKDRGRPILLVYRVEIMRDPQRVVAAWRDAARRAGFPDLYICAVASFGFDDPLSFGFDALVEFPPHSATAESIDPKKLDANPEFEGQIYSYKSYVDNYSKRPDYDAPCHPGIMPRWDNTARKGTASHIFHGATPEEFERLSQIAIGRALKRPEQPPLLFINSWNEWAEGANLEPDRDSGKSYLEAYRRAWVSHTADPDPTDENRRLRVENSVLGKMVEQNFSIAAQPVTNLEPAILASADSQADELRASVDFLNGSRGFVNTIARTLHRCRISGWASPPRQSETGEPIATYLRLTDQISGEAFYALVDQHTFREDVVAFLGWDGSTSRQMGYEAVLDLTEVPPGYYDVSLLQFDEKDGTIVSWTSGTVGRLYRG
ncbi:glycosyltransferase WbsX family protein [Parvularcula lutaonensis]|uniref:Glycoside hydrolase family 99-like domain-containing protein n=1 Tax=Parvularcula lutaonensis TaxID=491923 RepID=A0ABV7MGA1_9PROT|nr:glycoside hydrolase family 99-like domain-containing protein [Parvularcula lutaonensis]GGY53991.1 hypothetical protein GCM10007148_24290 [Parvularcula lutaonensis]